MSADRDRAPRCFSTNPASTVTLSPADGDTIKVLDATNTQHKIRMQGIDAPEKAQAYGQKSKQSLSQMVQNKQVTVEYQKKDKYGRTLGKVILNGTDVCLEQIKLGMAWHYKQYQNEQTPDQRSVYDAAERAAREKRLGLWQGQGPASPEPPWDYRARLKSERKSAQNHATLPESHLQ